MIIHYPPTVSTDRQKIEYLYRLIELLKQRHNIKGRQYIDGTITEEQWRIFVAWFKDRNEAISIEILRIRQSFGSLPIDIDIDGPIFQAEQMAEG